MSLKEITDSEFESQVIGSDIPVLVDFWAPWCGPCRILSPRIEEISKEYDGKLEVVKVNVDENPNTADRYGVLSIPTLVLFKGGIPVERAVGALPKDEIIRKLRIDELSG